MCELVLCLPVGLEDMEDQDIHLSFEMKLKRQYREQDINR